MISNSIIHASSLSQHVDTTMKRTSILARSSAFQCEVAVIGAGVIGLAVGRALAMAGKEVLILDRAGAIGSGAF